MKNDLPEGLDFIPDFLCEELIEGYREINFDGYCNLEPKNKFEIFCSSEYLTSNLEHHQMVGPAPITYAQVEKAKKFIQEKIFDNMPN